MTKLLTIFILVFCITVAFSQNSYFGRATEIKDGDTFVFLSNTGENFTVRINAIDAPEKSQAFGKISTDFLISKILAKDIKCIVYEDDKYGRKLADVFLGEENINQSLVKGGYAWHYKKYSNDETLATLETVAKENKVGLWNYNPIAPWDYRQNKGVVSDTTDISVSQCGAITQKGTQCKRMAKSGSKYCWQHQNYKKSDTKITPQKQTASGRCQATTKKGTQCKRMAKSGLKYC